jgi:WhiB family redox-sensing transcriptional regulator
MSSTRTAILTEEMAVPTADLWDWQRFATCRASGPSVFYSQDGERGHAREQRVELAKAMCRRCPVMTQCRAHAMRIGEPHGIWGGLTESEHRGSSNGGEPNRFEQCQR